MLLQVEGFHVAINEKHWRNRLLGDILASNTAQRGRAASETERGLQSASALGLHPDRTESSIGTWNAEAE
jgi:hypothetical protein